MEQQFKTSEELYDELMSMSDKYYDAFCKDSFNKDTNEQAQAQHNITLKLIELMKQEWCYRPVKITNILPFRYGSARFEFEFDNHKYIFELWIYGKRCEIQILENEPDKYDKKYAKKISKSFNKYTFGTFELPKSKKYSKGNLVLYQGSCYTIKDYIYDSYSIRYELEYVTGSKTWAAESKLKKFKSGL